MEISVEKTTRYATNVAEMSDAWAFVMQRIDLLGPDPTVSISPVWTMEYCDNEDCEVGGHTVRSFNVIIAGTVPENADEAVGQVL